MGRETYYDVFVNSVYGSDILTFWNRDEAEAEAKRWAKEIGYKNPVVVVKVEKEVILLVDGKEGVA